MKIFWSEDWKKIIIVDLYINISFDVVILVIGCYVFGL